MPATQIKKRSSIPLAVGTLGHLPCHTNIHRNPAVSCVAQRPGNIAIKLPQGFRPLVRMLVHVSPQPLMDTAAIHRGVQQEPPEMHSRIGHYTITRTDKNNPIKVGRSPTLEGHSINKLFVPLLLLKKHVGKELKFSQVEFISSLHLFIRPSLIGGINSLFKMFFSCLLNSRHNT